MKTDNIEPWHPDGIIRGHVGALRSGSSGVSVVDQSGTQIDNGTLLSLVGLTANNLGDGVIQVAITGELAQRLGNPTSASLVVGEVMVIDSTGNLETTTTAQDTRPIAIVQINTSDVAVPVVTSGYAAQVNTTGTVAAGDYLETSTSAGVAESSGTTARAGTFGIALGAGPNPPALLFGLTYLTGGGGGGGVPGWYNVRDYGAVGNGTTDDTAAINAAIAALNAAGGGVLYFPYGTYKCTSALTTISVTAVILGDGHGYTDSHGGGGSEVRQTSATAVLFTVTATGTRFLNIGMRCTAASPSAGSGIHASADFIRYDNIAVSNFYDCIDHNDGGAWKMDGCWIVGAVRYGIRIRDVSSTDGGDQGITNSWIYADQRNGTAAIRIESGGGLKIANVKINKFVSGSTWTTGISVAPAASTTIMLIANNSIENVTGNGIDFQTSGSYWRHVSIAGNQFGLYSNSTGSAININCGTLAEVSELAITNNIFKQSGGGSAAAINLTKVQNAYISGGVRDGFGSMLAQSGCTSIVDATGGVAAGVAITGTPTSGQVPVASSGTAAAWGAVAGGITGLAAPALTLGTSNSTGSATTAVATDATIAAFDATVPAAIGTAATGSVAKAARRDHVHPTGAGTPTTSAIGDAAATGSGPAASMTDHVHGREALSTATPLVESGSGATGTGTLSSREDHVHPAGGSSAGTAVPIWNVTFNGDGSTTVFELPAAPYDAYAIGVYIGTGRNSDWALSGTMLTTLTFGTAPTSGTNNVSVDIMAATL